MDISNDKQATSRMKQFKMETLREKVNIFL